MSGYCYIKTASEAVSLLEKRINDDRPLNMAEMSAIHSLLSPILKSAKNLLVNMTQKDVPSWLVADFNAIKQKL